MLHQTRPSAAVLARAIPDFVDGTQACASEDSEIFFPDQNGYTAARPARRICRRCPLKTACGTWAINTRQSHGIWAGMTPDQRRAAVRENGGKW